MEHPNHWELDSERITRGWEGKKSTEDEISSLIRHDDYRGLGIPNSAENIVGVDPLVVNRLLSNELNQLSFDRREQVLEEIHGVKSGGGVSLQSPSDAQLTRQQQEEITFIKFQEELDKYHFSDASNPLAGDLRNCRYPAYRFAKENGSELINDRNFRLTFFGRGEGENCAKKGAKRMLNYLEFIRQIYDTNDVLFRPICLSDLNEDLGSKEFMYEKAPLQILPVKDPSGRRIIVLLRDFGPSSCPVLVRQQVGMYFVQSMNEDCDGTIFVFFLHHAHHNLYHPEEFRNFNRLLETIPPKFSAFHLCCPEGRLYDIAKAAVTLLIGKENRERLRLHVGSYQECKYALRSFGIPVDRLPIDLDSKGRNMKRKQFDIKYHQKWLSMREAKESAMFTAIRRDNRGKVVTDMHKGIGESFNGVMTAVHEIRSKFVECPRHEDCLFGKGRPAMYHPGNIAMRRLLEQKFDRFEAMEPNKKSSVVWEVVNEIKEGTGRFLKEDSDHAGVFVTTDDETAFKKIAIAFRDLKKRRLREEEHRDAGDSKQSSPQQDTPPTVIRRKRPATSVAESSTIPSEKLSLNDLERNMSFVMDKTMNDETQRCLSSLTKNAEDTVSKQRKLLTNSRCFSKCL